MPKAKSKRKTSSHSNSKKTIGRNSKTQTARKAAKLKPPTQSAVGRQPRTSSQQPGRVESKQARIIAMLRTPGGATIEAMVHATGWQQHSVRIPRWRCPQDSVQPDFDAGKRSRPSDRRSSG
jgi:hypothetical protein